MSFGELRSFCHDAKPNKSGQNLMDLLRSCDDVQPLYAIQYVVDQGLGAQLFVDRWRCTPIDGRTQVGQPFVEDTKMYNIHADIWINGCFVHLFDVSHLDAWTWYRSQVEHYLCLYEAQRDDIVYNIEPAVFLDRIEEGLSQYDDFDFETFHKDIRQSMDWSSAHNFSWLSQMIAHPHEALILLEVLKRNERWSYPTKNEREACKRTFNTQFIQHMLTTKTMHPKIPDEPS